MVALVHSNVFHMYSQTNEGYYESMASPAGSADGLEITAQMSTSPSVRITDFNEKCSELELNFNDVILDNLPPPSVHFFPTSSVIEIFEGVVQSVSSTVMHVVLRAKRNTETPDHAMAIELEFVQPQDRDLVAQGSVFYLTMFRETTGKTVKNVEEIRFRRQPDWNGSMFRQLEALSAAL